MGMVCDILLVCHYDNRLPALLKITKQFHNLLARLAVQIARGPIRKDDGGVVNQCPCHGHTLPLPSREFGWPVGQATGAR